MQTEPLHQHQLFSSPSFSTYSSDALAHIAARVIHELHNDPNSLNDVTLSASPKQNDNLTPDQEQNDDVADDFEFAFLSTNPVPSPVSADDIFHNGQITPTYPLFDRTLLNGVVSVTPIASSGDAETAPRRRRLPLKMLMADDSKDLDGVAAGDYCVWTPSCKKSSSTGSSSSLKRWKLRDLLHRSHSDGKHGSVVDGGASVGMDGYPSKRRLGFGWVVQ